MFPSLSIDKHSLTALNNFSLKISSVGYTGNVIEKLQVLADGKEFSLSFSSKAIM